MRGTIGSIRLLGIVAGVLIAGIVSVPGSAVAKGQAPSNGGGSAPTYGAAAPVAAVRLVVSGEVWCLAEARTTVPAYTPGPRCPLTPRLVRRIRVILRNHANAGPGSGAGNLLTLGMQATPPIAGYTVYGNTGARALVVVVMKRNEPAYLRAPNLSYITVRFGRGWLIDNVYCTGHPAIGLYTLPLGETRCPGSPR